jgi:hypothetical protein
MFCGSMFSREAQDLTPAWSSVEKLVKRYGRSKTSTLRRFVERGPDRPMVMFASTPYWEEKPPDQANRTRYCVPSPQFAQRFSSVEPDVLLSLVDRNSRRRVGGPVADFPCSLRDDNGDEHEFHAESFFNGYYILTLFAEVPGARTRHIIVPRGSLPQRVAP